MSKDIYTPTEVAKICGISHKTVANYCDQGKIKSEQSPITKYRKISREDLIEFMNTYQIPLSRLDDGRDFKVLIVEDNVADQEELQRLLRKHFSEHAIIYEAYDGYNALIDIGKHDPDIVFLDLAIPEIEGLDVCKKIKDKENMKIIIVSGNQDPDIHSKAMENGADAFYTKPIDKKKLVKEVSELMNLSA